MPGITAEAIVAAALVASIVSVFLAVLFYVA